MSQNKPFVFGAGAQQNSDPAPPVSFQSDANIQSAANGPVPSTLQQMALQQNGAPLSIDLGATLRNITPDQLALITQLLQSGALTLPPNAPGALQAAVSAATAVPPTSAPPFGSKAPVSNHSAHQNENMRQDEGEGSDDQDGSVPAARGYLYTPPKGPRNQSTSFGLRTAATNVNMQSSQQNERTSGFKPPAPSPETSTMNHPSSDILHPHNFANASMQPLQVNSNAMVLTGSSRERAVQYFVLEMHKAGYTFEQLSKEVTHVHILRRIYQKLGLPVETTTSVISSAPSLSQNDAPLAEPEEQRRTSVTRRTLPTRAPTTQDRSAYLAKLQAAKNRRSDQTTTSAITPQQPVVDTAGASTSVAHQNAPSMPSVQPSAPVPVAVRANPKNELIRQRLEALKAQQAAKQRANTPSADSAVQSILFRHSNSSPQTASRPGLGDGLAEAAARAQNEAMQDIVPAVPEIPQPFRDEGDSNTAVAPVASHAPPSTALPSPASSGLNRGFGLPGLFTTGTPPTPVATHLQPQRPLRPISSNSYGVTIPRPDPPFQSIAGSPTPFSIQREGAPGPPQTPNNLIAAKRSLSLKKSTQADEPFVIIDSDEESEADMEIDDDDLPQGIALKEAPVLSLGPLGDISPKHSFQNVTGSVTPGTPGTPSTDLKRKLEQIEDAKRRIAEIQQRQKITKPRMKPTQTDQANAEVTTTMPSSLSVSEATTPSTEPMLNTDTNGHPLSTSVKGVQSSGYESLMIESLAGQVIPVALATTHSQSRSQEKQALQQRLEILMRQRDEAILKTGGVSLASGSNTVTAPPTGPLASDIALPQEAAELEVPDTDTNADDLSGEYAVLYGTRPDKLNYDEAKVATHVTPVSDPPKPTQRGINENITQSSAPNNDEVVNGTASSYAQEAEIGLAHTEKDERPENGVTQADFMDENDVDDDDLDDIYGPSTSPPVVHAEAVNIPIEPTPMQDNENEENMGQSESGEGNDSDDAMDTSDASSIDYEPGHLPPAPPPPMLDVVGVDVSTENETNHTNNSLVQSNDDLFPSDDDLAPELQPSKEELVVPSEEIWKPQTSYSAYESPLSHFKDYRYHPEFLNYVPGGFKSLTYSHNIDPDLVVCPFETAGGICNDKNCAYQHFRTMELSDNEILRFMGTEKLPVHSPDDDKRWKAGLTTLVQELRRTGQGKDVSAIARRIAQYRRDFIGDATKTLVLT